MQKVSQLVQNNQTFNSNSYKNLSPVMKEAISDVMKLVDNKTDDLLKTFEIKNVIRTEQGVIPMAIIKNNSYKDEILKIGTSVGMVRPSSGYSMRRIASWLLGIKIVKLNNKSYK